MVVSVKWLANKRKRLYLACIAKYGVTNQLRQVQEEAAELIQAINKFCRCCDDDTYDKLCSEIADMEVMIEQIKLIINENSRIQEFKEYKLNRLVKIVNNEEL
jgi:NTP pyrophosphatase (non-canonical NTP hydrolase)